VSENGLKYFHIYVGRRQKYIFAHNTFHVGGGGIVVPRLKNTNIVKQTAIYILLLCYGYIILYYCYTFIIIIYIRGKSIVYRGSTNLLRILQRSILLNMIYIFCTSVKHR